MRRISFLKNMLKEMLRAGRVAIGTTLTIGNPDVSEAIGHAGYDWALIDTEHSPMTYETAQLIMQAMNFSKTVPIIRVTWNDLALIKRALDIGAFGVVVPWVNTREEAIQAVNAVRYPPQGMRGYGPRRAGLADPDYQATANSEVFLGVQIETQKALDNLDEILSVEGIDSAVVGPADLSLSMGIFRQFDHPRFEAAMKNIAEAARRHGVTPGMLAVDDFKKRLDQGFKLLNISGDLGFIIEGARSHLDRARKILAEV